jgi:hypothetical protein
MITAAVPDKPRTVYWLVPALGLAWNSFGIYQFISSATASRESLALMGATPDQAALYAGLPGWMTVAFALGVFGGLAGSLLLGLQRKAALPVLAASLAAYIVLYVGDITEGVFAAFGMQQVAILTAVVLIAVGLLLFGLRARNRGVLT